MPRPFFPHTLHDVTRNVDGPLGLIAADMPDGTLFVLKRSRRTGAYTMTHYADTRRSAVLKKIAHTQRRDAINALSEAIGLNEFL